MNFINVDKTPIVYYAGKLHFFNKSVNLLSLQLLNWPCVNIIIIRELYAVISKLP